MTTLIQGEEMLSTIGNVCSILSLIVSFFVLTKVVKISNVVNSVYASSARDDTKSSVTVTGDSNTTSGRDTAK